MSKRQDDPAVVKADIASIVGGVSQIAEAGVRGAAAGAALRDALLIAPSTPIVDALLLLRDADLLMPDDADGCALLSGVRTYGDLLAVLERGDIPGTGLAVRLREALRI